MVTIYPRSHFSQLPRSHFEAYLRSHSRSHPCRISNYCRNFASSDHIIWALLLSYELWQDNVSSSGLRRLAGTDWSLCPSYRVFRTPLQFLCPLSRSPLHTHLCLCIEPVSACAFPHKFISISLSFSVPYMHSACRLRLAVVSLPFCLCREHLPRAFVVFTSSSFSQ